MLIRRALILLAGASLAQACTQKAAPAPGAAASPNSAPAPTPAPTPAPAAPTPAPAAPTPTAPDVQAAEPTPAAVDVAAPSPVEGAKERLSSAEPKAALTLLKELQTHASKSPAPADSAEATTLVVTGALAAAATATEANDVESARALLELVLSADGVVAPGVAESDAEALRVVGRVMRAGATLWDAAALAPLAAGESSVARIATALNTQAQKQAAAVFTDLSPTALASQATALASGPWACPEKSETPAECPPEWFGLQEAGQLAAVPKAALPLLRAAVMAHGAGEAAPKGVVELPRDPQPLPEGTSVGLVGWSPLEILVVTTEGASLTERPLYDLGAAKLVAGKAWPGEVKQDAASLEAARETTQVEKLAQAISSARAPTEREDAVAGPAQENDPRNSSRSSGAWVLNTALDGAAPARRFAPALAAAGQAGFSQLRAWRTGGSLPVLLSRSAVPDERAGRAEEPLRVVVRADGFKIVPARSKAAPLAAVEAPTALPETAVPTRKGNKLVSVDLPTGDLTTLSTAVRAVREAEGSGAVVVVELDPDVTAARALDVVAALGNTGAAPLTKVSEVYPGVTCQDENPAAGEGCMSAWVVLDVALPGPKKVVEKVEKPAPPPEPPKEQVECDKTDIQTVIRARTGAIRFCYERQLQMNNELKGKVVVRLNIGSSGSVNSATSSGNMPDKGVHECVLKAMKALKFKPPSGGGTCVVNYPFIFQP